MVTVAVGEGRRIDGFASACRATFSPRVNGNE